MQHVSMLAGCRRAGRHDATICFPPCRSKDNPDGYTVLAVAENRQSIDLVQVVRHLSAAMALAVVCEPPSI